MKQSVLARAEGVLSFQKFHSALLMSNLRHLSFSVLWLLMFCSLSHVLIFLMGLHWRSLILFFLISGPITCLLICQCCFFCGESSCFSIFASCKLLFIFFRPFKGVQAWPLARTFQRDYCYKLNVCAPPPIHMLKPNSHREGLWR